MDAATLPKGPVAWDPSLGAWTVTGYELVKQALRDTERFTSENGIMAANLGEEAMLADDSPVHDAVRAVWARSFGVSGVMARRAEIEQLARELLTPIFAALRRGETVDIVPVLDAMAGRVVLGMLDFSQPREEEFTRLCKILLEASAFTIAADHPLYRAKAEAKAQVYAFLEDELHNRLDRLAGGERPTDLIALIAQAQGRSGITRTVALSNLFNVFVGGGDTTVRWMGNAIVLLHQHPEALAELRANPALLPQALEEVMRIRSVTRFAIRAVKIDGVELAGQALPRGDTVYLMGSLANLDPAVFEDPERFDIHRKAKPHLGFSHGMHLCIGMNLARIEAQVLLGQLLLAPDAPMLEIVEADYGDESVVRGPERLLLRMAD